MKASPGGLLAASLVLLAAVLVADVNVVEGAQRNVQVYDSEVLDDRVVRVSTVPSSRGDVVQVRPQWDIPGNTFATHEVWITAGGTGMASALAGTIAADAIEGVAGMRADAWVDLGTLTVTDPGGSPGLDVVRVYHFAPQTARPAEGEARLHFDALVRLESSGPPNPLILQEEAVRFHAFARIAIPLLSVASLASLAWWAWTIQREAGRPDADAPTASLVAVVALGGRYLRRMRGLAIGLLLPVALLAWLLLAFLGNEAAELVPPGRSWVTGLTWGVVVLVACLALALLVLAYTVHVRHREWKQAFARGPWPE